MATERADGWLVPGHSEWSNWDMVIEDIQREGELTNWYAARLKDERMLLALAKNLLDKLFIELSLRENRIKEEVGRNVRIVQPVIKGFEASCKTRDVKVSLNAAFCQQDEVALCKIIERMKDIAHDLGFKIQTPLNMRENQYFHLTCPEANTSENDDTLL